LYQFNTLELKLDTDVGRLQTVELKNTNTFRSLFIDLGARIRRSSMFIVFDKLVI